MREGDDGLGLSVLFVEYALLFYTQFSKNNKLYDFMSNIQIKFFIRKTISYITISSSLCNLW
jgi:hypothetical protein